MGTHKRISGGKPKLVGGALLGAVASGALAVGALSGAGVANAACASISGIGNGNGCTSTPGNFAVVVGTGTATAAGTFSGAVSVGTNNSSTAAGVGTLAAAIGQNNTSIAALGPFATAVGVGKNNTSLAAGPLTSAFSLGNSKLGNVAVAGPGIGLLAANFGTDSQVIVGGVGNTGWNLMGDKNTVLVTGGVPDLTNPLKSTFGGNMAFNAFGSGNNIVQAGSNKDGRGGAIAGNLFRNGPTFTRQVGPGININNSNDAP